MRRTDTLVLLLLSLGLISCVAPLTKQDAFPDHYAEDPLTILVLPPVNLSTASDAPELYSTTIQQPLAEAGFLVLSVQPAHQDRCERRDADVRTVVYAPLAALQQTL